MSGPEPQTAPPADRPQLSVAQVAGSSLAAVSAAVVCSFFGVAGTVIGTAVASVLATVGSALYSYSVRRTQARLRSISQNVAAAPPVTAVLSTARQRTTHAVRRTRWPVVALGTANVFVLAIGVVTGIEGAIGTSLPAAFHVSHSGRDTTSLGSAFGVTHHRKATPSPSPSPASTPAPTSTGSGTPAPAPTRSTSTPSTAPTSARPTTSSSPSPTSSLTGPLPSPSLPG